MRNAPGRIRRLCAGLWQGIDAARRIALNLLFLFVALVLAAALLSGRGEKVPSSAVLVLSPEGGIVEQLSYQPPAVVLFRQGVDRQVGAETLLRDLVEAVELAATDRRIKAVFVDPGRLERAGLNKLQEIGAALQRLRGSGKPVIAWGESYTQTQYYLAAQADEVYLHPMGGVALHGYGVYRTYFRSALEKLRVQMHVFRVGTYKSALDPLLRDGMSPEDQEATLAWLEAIWQAYQADVEARRRLPPGALDGYIRGLTGHLDRLGGDTGRLALEQGLVDGLWTGDQVRRRLRGLAGGKGEDFTRIRFDRYARLARSDTRLAGPRADRVGVIVASGTVMDGQQPAGRIGGDTLAELFRRAREDGTIRAVVLRIDSGGGSAFASEVVRREVELTREAGKPVVASFSSVAASGGYWMAAAADEIWAAPTTITGSIGIFGAFPTFERSLEALGIRTDGVGTTPLAGAFDPRRPLQPAAAEIMQRVIERGYQRFVERVAQGRNLRPDQVESAAQGRVWVGTAAREKGLVDQLGGLAQAVAAAAGRAGLDRYEAVYVEREPTAGEALLRRLAEEAGGLAAGPDGPVAAVLGAVGREARVLAQMNDPQGVYAWCMTCDVE
jgi:protease IV